MNTDDMTVIPGQREESAAQPQESARKTSKSSLGKVVMFGSVPGVLLGAVGATMLRRSKPEEVIMVEDSVEPEMLEPASVGEVADEVPDDGVEEIVEETAEEPVGESLPALDVIEVNDDMTFAEAFAAARAGSGSEGVFEWHGNVYSTMTKEEWDAMNEEEVEVFAGKMENSEIEVAPVADVPADAAEPVVSEDVPEPVVSEDVVEEVVEDVVAEEVVAEEAVAEEVEESVSEDVPEPVVSEDVAEEVVDEVVAEEVVAEEAIAEEVVEGVSEDVLEPVAAEGVAEEVVEEVIAEVVVKEIVNDENIVVMEADENDMTASAVPGPDETPITDTALDEGIIIENVHIVQEEDSEMTLINAEVNGYSALFADIDSDGVIDMMAVDVNDDSSLSDDEVFDLKGTGITVDDLCSAEIEDKFGDADDEDMFLA